MDDMEVVRMMIGDPDEFAIESEITVAYSSRGMLGLGYFLIHLEAMAFGVRSPSATLLACSFDGVSRRLERQGQHHCSPFDRALDAATIADAVTRALYEPSDDRDTILGIPRPVLRDSLYPSGVIWAPDGDEAFDDGSSVLQFDSGPDVRLVGFRHLNNYRHDPSSLRDVSLPANKYYQILADWKCRFESQWSAMPKG